jgi:hypothetical protein
MGMSLVWLCAPPERIRPVEAADLIPVDNQISDRHSDLGLSFEVAYRSAHQCMPKIEELETAR